jgi:hypothetical protein
VHILIDHGEKEVSLVQTLALLQQPLDSSSEALKACWQTVSHTLMFPLIQKFLFLVAFPQDDSSEFSYSLDTPSHSVFTMTPGTTVSNAPEVPELQLVSVVTVPDGGAPEGNPDTSIEHEGSSTKRSSGIHVTSSVQVMQSGST